MDASPFHIWMVPGGRCLWLSPKERATYYSLIGKYLRRLREFDHVIAPQEGCEAQLQASRLPVAFRMGTPGMARQIGEGLLQRGIEPGSVPGLQGLDNAA